MERDLLTTERGCFLQLCRKILRWSLPILLVFFLATGSPKPAQATPCQPFWAIRGLCDGDAKWYSEFVLDIKNAISKIKWLMDLFDFITTIYDLLDKFLGYINDSWKAIGNVLGAGQEAETRAAVDTAQQKTDNATKDSETKAEAKALMEKPDPLILQQVICNMIVVRMLEIALMPFADLVSRMVAAGIPLEYAGAGGDGSGGQYDYRERQATCGNLDDGGPSMGNPIDGDTNSDCVASDDGISYATVDANNSPTTLARDNVYTVPKFVSQTDAKTGTTYLAPVAADGGLPSQVRWMGARNYCYTAAGRKPPPPYGKWAETPDGMRARAEYNHCTAMRSVFIKQCTDRLGFLSRPDCTNTDFDGLCKASRDACSAAMKVGIAPPGSFDNCEEGLSLYEAQYLSRMICLTGDRAGDNILAGLGLPAAGKDSDTCMLLLDAWKKQMALEESNWVRGMKMMTKVDKCWARYERMAPKSLPKSAQNDNKSSAKKTATEKAVQKQKALEPTPVRLETAPSEGDAFYADDLFVPAVAKKRAKR